MPIEKASHCAYDIHHHFMFAVKYRRAVLEPQVVAELVRISQETGERCETE